jgi:4-amino-4-deoxy-L-arabinose transferase-like glycosyltransferase
MYHLRIPVWLLEHGRLAVPPDSFHVALVGGAHFASLPLLAAGLASGPALMQVAALALVMAGTPSLARAAGASRRSGWLAAAMVLGSPVFVLVAITARVDVTLVLALVAAHLALLSAASHDDDPKALPIAALLVGAAMAIKPHAGAYALMLVPLGWRAARGLRPALVAAAIAVLVSAPWYVKNQVLVGAPLYPIGAPGWFEPWIAELFGNRVRPDSIDASVLRALPDARASFNLADAFLAPDKLTIEGEGAFYALSPMLVLLPLAALLFRGQARAAGIAAVGIGYALLVVLPFGRINLRYLMPAVPALSVGVAVALEWIAERAGARLSQDMRRVLAVVLLVTALLPLSGALRQRLLTGDQVLLRHAAGLASTEDVWRLHPDGTARSFAPVVMNVRRLVPENGKVLMLWEARGAPFGREVLIDVMLSNWSYVAQSGKLEDCLAGSGITHILAGSGSVEYYVGRGADPRVFMLDRFVPFRERCLVNHAVVGPGFHLFAVQPAAR